VKFDFFMPTRIKFGPGSLEALGTTPLPGTKALVVISAGGSMRRLGYLDRVLGLLEKNGVQSVVFAKIQPNPLDSHVNEGAELARAEGCDFVVGLGGGSSLDSAKSIAVMAAHPGEYWDYIHAGSGGRLPVVADALPTVAITTTAGTGSEADPWTVISKADGAEKIGFGHDSTFPTLSIVDPELMTSVPPQLTAYQGFDALFHATEGFISTRANPLSDLFALESIALIAHSLPAAVRDGGDLEARSDVALANTLSGMVETTSSCTSEHSLEHAMSAHHPALEHGAGLVMLAVAYYGFFLPHVSPDRYTRMAAAMGVDVAAHPEAEQPGLFVEALKRLIEDCGLADVRMSHAGIAREELPELAQTAHDTMPGLFTLDCHRLSMEETVAILEAAYR
jgi:alcohol dehydrogenase